jgi:hypothetical protein
LKINNFAVKNSDICLHIPAFLRTFARICYVFARPGCAKEPMFICCGQGTILMTAVWDQVSAPREFSPVAYEYEPAGRINLQTEMKDLDRKS